MTFYADRVKETTTTSGTGTIDLAGAEDGFQGFVAAGAATLEVEYVLIDGNAWETGVGTITDAAPDTLSRDTLIESSTGSKINLSGGTVDVHLTFSGQTANALMATEDYGLITGSVTISDDYGSIA